MSLNDDGKYALDTLSGLRDGAMLNELGRELARVVEGVQATLGAGSVTAVINVAMVKDRDDRVNTVDKITTKVPEDRRDVWFFDNHGHLTRYQPRNPNHPPLPFDDSEDDVTDSEDGDQEVGLPYKDDD